VLYGCEAWFLILREKHRFRVFENRMLRRMFGPKREEVAGTWRKLHNECFISIIRVILSRRIRWEGHVACTWEMRNAYSILLRRPRHMREDIIRMVLRKMG
jgi:hypothetical protein